MQEASAVPKVAWDEERQSVMHGAARGPSRKHAATQAPVAVNMIKSN